MARLQYGGNRTGGNYEEKTKTMIFGFEDDEGDFMAQEVRLSARFYSTDDDGRIQSRVMTRPVVMGTGADVAAMTRQAAATGRAQAMVHQTVRTRPVVSANYSQANYSGPPSHWSVQSTVAKKSANQKRPQQQQQPPQPQYEGRAVEETVRPRSSSETSFGRMFFAGRPARPASLAANMDEAGTAAAPASPHQPPPSQYWGKNVHNFSYADAKIYSPQPQQLQQQQQQQQQQHQQQQHQQYQQAPGNRVKIWWTMETMGAVNSAHSNQMLLARGAPSAAAAAVKVQGDYC